MSSSCGRWRDPRMLERAADLADLERQVLLALGRRRSPPRSVLPDNAILLADDLLPSQLLALDPARMAGLAHQPAAARPRTWRSSPPRMNIPAVVAAGPRRAGDRGRRAADPRRRRGPAAGRARAGRDRRRRRAAWPSAARAAPRPRPPPREPCRTADGDPRSRCSPIWARPARRTAAVDSGAEGCGLLRTEFLFLERDDAARRGRAGGRLPGHRRRRWTAGR